MNKEEKIVRIAKLISYSFLSTLISKESLTRLGDFYPRIESRKLASEWFALQLFLMIIAISSHYKDDIEGLEVAKVFRMYAVEGLVEAGVYGTENDATEFLKLRLGEYDTSYNGKENPLMTISIQFLKYINEENSLLLVNTGEQIATILRANMDLIKKAEQESGSTDLFKGSQ